ncbi:hypothetical protein ZTR_03763 [Talaromyces verruculosus]|nr:hypothetical protein ZTR_03763 [Talaromyces verruculosus]
MVVVYAARTLPVNPPEAPFVLKRDLLWQALQRKVRHATEFVPAMRSCNVISDKDDIVIRQCLLELPNGSMRNMREEVTSHNEQWEDGSVTTNLVSHGAGTLDEDLLLTYVFEWNYSDVEKGTAAEEEAIQMTSEMALMAVRQSIITARNLVLDDAL